MVGNPWIVGLDRAAERLKQGNERAREIAEADQADAGAIKREASFRAVEQPFLMSRSHGAIRRSHAAAEIDREPKRHLGDRPCESGPRRQHMDSALKARLVVDVLQKVRLDVDDGAQLRRAVEARLRHVALADQELHLGEIGFEALGRHAARALVDRELAKLLQPGPDLRLENLLERSRLRIDHDQGFRHQSPPSSISISITFGKEAANAL